MTGKKWVTIVVDGEPLKSEGPPGESFVGLVCSVLPASGKGSPTETAVK